MKTVVKVENLSKSYTLNHKSKENYHSFRDEIADSVKGFGKRIFSSFNSRNELTVNLEEFWALKEVSFEINQGERVGIIGPNGAGKSTLLKILSRIVSPTSGRYSLKGRVNSLLEVGTGFHPELTGRENIFLNGSVLGMRRNEIKVKFDEIVAFAEIEKFLDTPVKRYSSGMYVRLAFAVAAHLEPEILIVDEVLAVGDIHFQEKCLGKLEEVGRDGRTVIFVSHNMGIINNLCTKAFLFDKGNLIHSGEPSKVIQQYYMNHEQKTDAVTEFSFSTQDVQIRKITILNNDNFPSAQIPISEPFNICIEYEFLKPIDRALLIIVFHFFNEYLFLSAESDKTGEMKDYLQGKYETTVKIPAFLFNVGRYNFEVAIHRPYEIDFDRKKHIPFEILDINDPKSVIFKGNKFGRFAFMLEYDTKSPH